METVQQPPFGEPAEPDSSEYWRERALIAEENLSAALMQRDEETERADRAEALLSTLKLDLDLDDAYQTRGGQS